VTENSRAHDWHVVKNEEITRKFRLENPKFDIYLDPYFFSEWLLL